MYALCQTFRFFGGGFSTIISLICNTFIYSCPCVRVFSQQTWFSRWTSFRWSLILSTQEQGHYLKPSRCPTDVSHTCTRARARVKLETKCLCRIDRARSVMCAGGQFMNTKDQRSVSFMRPETEKSLSEQMTLWTLHNGRLFIKCYESIFLQLYHSNTSSIV